MLVLQLISNHILKWNRNVRTLFSYFSLSLSLTHIHTLSQTHSHPIFPEPYDQNQITKTTRECCPYSNMCTLYVLAFVYLFIYSLVSSFIQRYCIPPSRIKYNIKLRLTISLNSDSDAHSTVCMWMWVSWTVICSLWSLMIVLDTPTPKLDSLLIITVCVRRLQ
jgi:hypothetical protein